MPGNVVVSTPTQVMPYGLMQAFGQVIERPALVDAGYTQGESTRAALTTGSRSRFTIQRALTKAQKDELELFQQTTMDGRPFWFYNLRETQPPGSYDITGANPIGRYTVVWEGTFSMAVSNGERTASAGFALREVAG